MNLPQTIVLGIALILFSFNAANLAVAIMEYDKPPGSYELQVFTFDPHVRIDENIIKEEEVREHNSRIVAANEELRNEYKVKLERAKTKFLYYSGIELVIGGLLFFMFKTKE